MRQGSHVVMVGSALDAPGGITSVVQAYRDSGLFARWSVIYLASFREPGLWGQLLTVPAALVRFLSLLLRRKVWLLHVHSAARGSFFRKTLFCALAALFRVPIVLHIHSGEFAVFYRQECSALLRWWVRWHLRKATRVAVLTPGWAQVMVEIEPAARIRVLLNPVPVGASPVARGSRGPFNVLFLGRLRQKKGVFDLVRAMPGILNRHPGTRFCLAGDGDLSVVRALAAELKVENALDLPGWIDGPTKGRQLHRATLLVLPSHFEGLPICVLEAMAAGVPIVATRVGGVPFALDDGHCGVLVPVGDPAALASAVNGLLADEDQRRALAVAAHRRARDFFSVEAVVSQLEQLWAEALGPGGCASVTSVLKDLGTR